MTIRKNQRITAADEDNMMDAEFEPDFVDDGSTVDDTIDDIADDIEEIQDKFDDIDEDDIDIEIDNNIAGHYIAECDRCQGIFISSVIETEQFIEKVTGECPLCGKESEQNLKWVIKDVER